MGIGHSCQSGVWWVLLSAVDLLLPPGRAVAMAPSTSWRSADTA